MNVPAAGYPLATRAGAWADVIVNKGSTAIEELEEELVADELEEIELSLDEVSLEEVAVLEELEVDELETVALDVVALDEAALEVVGVDEEAAEEEAGVVTPQLAKRIATGRIQSKCLLFIMTSRQPY